MNKKLFAAAAALGLPAGYLLAKYAKTKTLDAPETAGDAPIGIIGAMDEEIAYLKHTADITKTRVIAGMEFFEGTLGGKNVVLVKCGVGKVNGGICAHTLINTFGCTKIINTGVAGSLDGKKIDIGDIVVSTDAVQHDFDAEAVGFQRGEIPFTGVSAFPADEALRAAAVEAVKRSAPDVGVHEGRVCSGDQFVATKAQKANIVSAVGGACCEMEGAAIAQACYMNGTPFVVIRAISDNPDNEGSVDYSLFEMEAAARCAKIVRDMVERL